MALIAVGGYGRGELQPASDIDISILLRDPLDADSSSGLEAFVTFLWDIGLEVGHSVRTIEDCRREAEADISVATNLMEARLLVGDSGLLEAMNAATGPDSIWPTPKFFEAKLTEQLNRHHKFYDTASNRISRKARAASATSRSSAGSPSDTSARAPCTTSSVTAF